MFGYSHASLSVDETGIAYRIAGAEDAAPMMLLHGFTGNSRNWALVAPHLVEAGFRTLSPDHPGHGRSAAPEDPEIYGMDALARAHHELASDLGFSPSVVVGHSMGGAVAEEFAIAHPDSVRALILVDSAGGGQTEDWIKGLNALVSDNRRSIAREHGMTGLYDYQVEKGYRDVNLIPEEYRSLVREEFALTSTTGYFNCAVGMRDRQSSLEALAGFNKPTLIMRGRDEDPSFIRISEELHETISGSRYEIIEGAGHNPQIQAPDRFVEVLCDFLDSLD